LSLSKNFFSRHLSPDKARKSHLDIPTLNRIEHFSRCLDSLEGCTGADKTDVFIGLDYPPTDEYVEGWKKICEYLKNKEKNNGFKSLTVVRRSYNYGITGAGSNGRQLLRWLGGLLAFCVPLLVVSYQTDAKMRERMRFGFEGFFNLVEKGRFSYTSNEKLGTMFVWPDNVKTWLVGDGYFSNPVATDAHYTGEITRGYYMGTDVGYLRFIFYFGMVGLLMFSFFMLKVGQVCIRKFPHWKVLFLMLLAVHFIVWAKVSTDIFLVFALFLCLDNNEDPEKNSIITDYETTEQQRTKRVLSGNS